MRCVCVSDSCKRCESSGERGYIRKREGERRRARERERDRSVKSAAKKERDRRVSSGGAFFRSSALERADESGIYLRLSLSLGVCVFVSPSSLTRERQVEEAPFERASERSDEQQTRRRRRKTKVARKGEASASRRPAADYLLTTPGRSNARDLSRYNPPLLATSTCGG